MHYECHVIRASGIHLLIISMTTIQEYFISSNRSFSGARIFLARSLAMNHITVSGGLLGACSVSMGLRIQGGLFSLNSLNI